MSVDPPLVASGELLERVRGIVADVLMVPRDKVRDDSAIVGELGAESIDFLDLIFRIEDVVGKKIPASRWSEFVAERFVGADLSRVITTASIVEFAERERQRP